MATANNIGGADVANWSAPANANQNVNTRERLPSTGRFPWDDCPSAAARQGNGAKDLRGLCLKTTARDPWDYLGLGNTLTMEQKALLGC